MESCFVRLVEKCGAGTQLVCTVTGEQAELSEGQWILSEDASGIPFVQQGAVSQWVLDVLKLVPRRNGAVLEVINPDNSVRSRGERLNAPRRSLEQLLCDYQPLTLPVAVSGNVQPLEVACFGFRQGFHGSTAFVDIRMLRAVVFHSDKQSAAAWVQHSLLQWRSRVDKSGMAGQHHVRRERNRLSRDHTFELFFGCSLKVFDAPVLSSFALTFLLQTWCFVMPSDGLCSRVFAERHFTWTISDDPKKAALADGIVVGGAIHLQQQRELQCVS
eukprot:3202519-Amphidinium_carterae.1